MISTVVTIYAIAIVMVLAAFLIFQQSRREAFIEKVGQRMAESSGVETRALMSHERRVTPALQNIFWRAGIEASGSQLFLGFICIVLLAVFVGFSQGLATGLSVPVISILVIYLWLTHKAKKRIALILVQLPLFLDQVLRGLATGRSMEGSLELAADETPDPLKEIIERVLRANELGADLGDAIQEAADLYRVNELYLLALAIRINRTFGSSVRELLQNVVNMIHEREAAQRELRALTGETRITAWVLGMLPPSMAVYIMAMNPSYLEGMWQDSTGQILLITAVALQITGAFVLWRMVKSI